MSHKMASLPSASVAEEEEINRYVRAEIARFGEERYLETYHEARFMIASQVNPTEIRRKLIVKPEKMMPSQAGEMPKIGKAHSRTQKAFHDICKAAVEHAVSGRPPKMPRGY